MELYKIILSAFVGLVGIIASIGIYAYHADMRNIKDKNEENKKDIVSIFEKLNKIAEEMSGVLNTIRGMQKLCDDRHKWNGYNRRDEKKD